MKLQILVPHYKETIDEISQLLDSIKLQQSVDFNEVGVIIVYDGDESMQLPESDWENLYPFKIKHIHSEKLGVSGIRNVALHNATADYVMFCDADDMFCHICGLYIIFREIEQGFDTLTSCFIEETRDPKTKEPVYVNHDTDSTFVHGKIHRRNYLLSKGIEFNPKLTIHEDSYFNILAQNCTKNAKYCPTAFYLWKWRDASVCRHDPDYILKTYNNMLDSNDELVNKFIEFKMQDQAKFYTGFMIMDAYYTMNKKEWIDKTHKDYRDSVEQRFSKYFNDHKHLWEQLTTEEQMTLSNGIRQRSVMEGMPMESLTLDAWLEHIESL